MLPRPSQLRRAVPIPGTVRAVAWVMIVYTLWMAFAGIVFPFGLPVYVRIGSFAIAFGAAATAHALLTGRGWAFPAAVIATGWLCFQSLPFLLMDVMHPAIRIAFVIYLLSPVPLLLTPSARGWLMAHGGRTQMSSRAEKDA